MPFQPGNTEATKKGKNKPYADALRMEAALAENGEPSPAKKGSLRWIARRQLELAGTDTAAAREVADRLDGKVPQAIAGIDENEGLKPLVPIINLTVGAKSESAPEAEHSVSNAGN